MASPPSPTMARLVGRISVAFFLDLVSQARGLLETLDALIWLTIVQANIAAMAREPDLAMTYASYDDVPPDELRRPVSISAIAQSLRLPYETVRRRVARLAGLGLCVITPRGVYVPAAQLHSPSHREASMASYELVRSFYLRLQGLGAVSELPSADPAIGGREGALPVRAVLRISSDYALRMIDLLIEQMGDLMHGLVLLTIFRCNTEHLTDDQRGTDDPGPAGFVPDGLRRPVRVGTISQRLAAPEETVRRHAARLVADRYCVREPEGLLVPAHVLARPRLMQLTTNNHAYVRRMFEGLARLGVLADWERVGTEALA